MTIWLDSRHKIEPLIQGDVHLWLSLFSDGQITPEGLSLLSRSEHTRADRFVKPEDRARFIWSRIFLRQVLARYIPISATAIEFVLGDHGKPFIANSAVHFNLSHSGDAVLIGVTLNDAIGVDIEHVRKNHDFIELAKRFFTPAEFCAIQTAQNPVSAFYRCWTRKESFIKATGVGLTFGLSHFEMDANVLSPEKSALIDIQRDTMRAQEWFVQSIALDDFLSDYFAAMTVEEFRVQSAQIHHYLFSSNP